MPPSPKTLKDAMPRHKIDWTMELRRQVSEKKIKANEKKRMRI